MRVLVVPKWYPWPDRPVFGSFCREHARALALEHDVTVLASGAVRHPDFAIFQLRDGIEDGLRTLRLRYRRPAFRPASMACQIVGMMVALYRLRRQGWRPEIVHAHVYSAGLPALILGRLSRASVVITEHYTGFQRGLITGYDRLTARVAFRYADLVAPVSHDLARSVLALQPRARVRVVENVVDTAVFHPESVEAPRQPENGGDEAPRQPPNARDEAPPQPANGRARLLTVADLVPKKGHVFLLEALAQIRRDRDVTLDLVGEGELGAALREQVVSLGLEQAVRFHGERPKHEVAEFMRRADLFVLPSLFENLPCVLIEAMASGLPFVATNVGGIPELMDGAGGALCPPHDADALAQAIARALDARDELDRHGLAHHAQQRFGYSSFVRAWTQIYDELRCRPAITD
jgi:glycosyltransferase involved in cell wall biosynthesis